MSACFVGLVQNRLHHHLINNNLVFSIVPLNMCSLGVVQQSHIFIRKKGILYTTLLKINLYKKFTFFFREETIGNWVIHNMLHFIVLLTGLPPSCLSALSKFLPNFEAGEANIRVVCNISIYTGVFFFCKLKCGGQLVCMGKKKPSPYNIISL
jgi:hypothetical protein